MRKFGNPVTRGEALSSYYFGGGPDNVTSTTTAQVPDFLRGPLTTAVNASQNAFTGGNSTSSGGPVGRFGDGGPAGRFGNTATGDQSQDLSRQNQGLDALFNRGAEGSSLVKGAQGLTEQTIRGDFLSPDSNPFLQGTFDRAADLTRGRLDTEFAGAGRNLGASKPARSEELQTLASNIFGGNFQAERGRQQDAVNQSLPLAANDFSDIQAQIDSGAFSLDQFINRLSSLIPGAGGTTRSTQPVFKTGLF